MKLYNDENNDRAKIKSAFQSLTERNIVALWRYMSDRATALNEIRNNYPKEQGYVFYTSFDDKNSFDEAGNLVEPLFLTWEGDGEAIREEINKAGFRVSWDGTPATCIAVLPNKKLA